MGVNLTLVVRSGPMIGHRQEVEGTETTIGGKGSAADVELSGLPYGVKYAEFRREGPNRWRMEEVAPGTVQLNGRRLRRRNALSAGDQIAFPSLVDGDVILVEVEFERVKDDPASGDGDGFKIKPLYIAGGVAYLLMMVMGAVFFLSGSPGDDESQRSTVAELLHEDIADADPARLAVGSLVTEQPATFNELMVILASGLPDDVKDARTADFVLAVERRFAQARRLADLGLGDEARAEYEAIIAMLRNGQLKTTEQALEELGAISEKRAR